MCKKPLMIPPKELAKHYGFPYQTMLNWSKVENYKNTIYRVLEKNMIAEMNEQTQTYKVKIMKEKVQ